MAATVKLNRKITKAISSVFDASHQLFRREGRFRVCGDSKYLMTFVQIGRMPGVKVIARFWGRATTSSGFKSFLAC